MNDTAQDRGFGAAAVAGRPERAVYDEALRPARERAFAPGEFVGQESFMTAREILLLARRAGVGPGTRVLDLCCGVAGSGRLVARATGCAYLGVDAAPDAVAVARQRAADLPCRFEVSRVPPLPPGEYDVVLLLETLLAFGDKPDLLHHVAAALRPGGRFACTLEQGPPLTTAERHRMPASDTVHLVPKESMAAHLVRAGMHVEWRQDVSGSHRRVAAALAQAFAAERDRIVPALGRSRWSDLVAAHRLWAAWLGSGRVRKVLVVARRE